MNGRSLLIVIVALLVSATACLSEQYAADGGCYLGEVCATGAGGGAGGAAGGEGGGGGGIDPQDAGLDGGERFDAGVDAGESDAGDSPDASCDEVPWPRPSVTDAGHARATNEAGIDDSSPTYASVPRRLCYFKAKSGAQGIYCIDNFGDLGSTSQFQPHISQQPFAGELANYPELSADGTELYVSVHAPSSTTSRLYRAKHHPAFGYGYTGRERLLSQFLNPTSVALSPDGGELYFTNLLPSLGEIWVARRTTDGGFSDARKVENVNDPDGGVSFGTTISPDGRFMIFERTDAGLFLSERRCGVWSAPEPFVLPPCDGVPGALGVDFGPDGELVFYGSEGGVTLNDVCITSSGND